MKCYGTTKPKIGQKVFTKMEKGSYFEMPHLNISVTEPRLGVFDKNQTKLAICILRQSHIMSGVPW